MAAMGKCLSNMAAMTHMGVTRSSKILILWFAVKLTHCSKLIFKYTLLLLKLYLCTKFRDGEVMI